MVIIHIANINTSVIGGVQVAVPQLVKAQSQYASVGLVNTCGDSVDGVQMLDRANLSDTSRFPAPFNKPDLVVFHEVYRFEYIKIYPVLVAAKIPYVVIPHGCLSKTAQRKKWVKKVAANLLFFNRFVKSAQLVQYLSENEKNMTAFPQYKSIVLGNGIPLPKQKKESFSENGIHFVYIGRLDMHIKGLDLLLKAVKQCETVLREHNALFEICGPDYDDAHAKINKEIDVLNISDLVRVHPAKMGREKEAALLLADCFIQASRTEGLPLGPLEALGYGVPCIVTDGVGLGPVIEEFNAGYRCATRVDGIVLAIERFVREFSDAKRLSQGARSLAETLFDIDRVAGKTVEQYRQIVTPSNN